MPLSNTSINRDLFRHGCHFERPQGVEKSVIPIKRTDCHGHKCPRNDRGRTKHPYKSKLNSQLSIHNYRLLPRKKSANVPGPE